VCVLPFTDSLAAAVVLTNTRLPLFSTDNLVSKLNAQKGATAGDIIKQMGWYSLFTRGLGLRIIMIGTLTGLQVRGCW
jgi:hypothetical protein